MKKAFILCIVTFFILMGILFYAEYGVSTPNASASPNLPPKMGTAAIDAPTAAETEIRQILEKYYEIARTNDRDALKKYSREISAPEYRYSSELGVKDKMATARMFDSKRVEYLSAGFDDFEVQAHGDVAIVKYRDISLARADGAATLNKPVRFTNVWVKRDGRWQIVAEHSSVQNAPVELLPRNRFADNLARK